MTKRDGPVEPHGQPSIAHRVAALLLLLVLAFAGAYPFEVLVTTIAGRFDLVPSSRGEIGLLVVFALLIVIVTVLNSRARIAAAARQTRAPVEPSNRP